MRRLAAVLLGIITLVVIGGVAVASIPDSSGVIHGCRKTNGGALSVIDSATQTCPSGTVPLNWSQTGPPGLSGLTTISHDATVPADSTQVILAVCPTGKVATGGGISVTANNSQVMASQPNAPGTGANATSWLAQVRNLEPTSPITATAWVVCATVAA